MKVCIVLGLEVGWNGRRRKGRLRVVVVYVISKGLCRKDRVWRDCGSSRCSLMLYFLF